MRWFEIHRATHEREACSSPAARAAVAVVLGLALPSACATVPYTGRHQLAIVSDADEIGEGEQLYGAVRRRTLVSPDREAQALVRTVGRRIAAVAGEPEWKWDFTLFADDDEVNAWALPGGKVGVYTGIFPIARDDAGLATIIGHEIAHAIAHHSGERASQSALLGKIGDGLSIAAGLVGPAGSVVEGAYGLGAQYGVMLPFSRTQESEADEIGLILMAKAGYDPRVAVRVWERMAEVERSDETPPEFASTHPSYGTRIKRIHDAIPTAMRYYTGGRRARPLPRLDALAKPDAAEKALLDSMERLDHLVATSPTSPAVASAIASEFDTSPERVVRLANDTHLSPGETAFALALARNRRANVTDIVRESRRRSWYQISRDHAADPRGLTGELDQIARQASAR